MSMIPLPNNSNLILENKKVDDIEETLKSLENENDELQNVERLYFENAKKFSEKKFTMQKSSENRRSFDFLPKEVNANEQELETEVS